MYAIELTQRWFSILFVCGCFLTLVFSVCMREKGESGPLCNTHILSSMLVFLYLFSSTLVNFVRI